MQRARCIETKQQMGFCESIKQTLKCTEAREHKYMHKRTAGAAWYLHPCSCTVWVPRGRHNLGKQSAKCFREQQRS